MHQTLNCIPEDFQPVLSTAMFLRPLFSWNSAKLCCFYVELSFKCWELTSSGSSSQPVTLSGAVFVPQDSYSSSGIILQAIFYRTSQSFFVRLSSAFTALTEYSLLNVLTALYHFLPSFLRVSLSICFFMATIITRGLCFTWSLNLNFIWFWN